ncbi:MAG: hypothetical protein OEY94_05345 [Alphaproteobacteria bacterium]|nr:hypothetical protein [Alphaproteobacteria bacterium]
MKFSFTVIPILKHISVIPDSEAKLNVIRESSAICVQAKPARFTGSPPFNLPSLKLRQGAGMTTGKTYQYSKGFFFILFCAFLVLPVQVKAEDISITPQMVEGYFDQLKAFYTSEEPDVDAIIEFTEKYIDDSIYIESTYDMNTTKEPVILRMDKTELLNSLKTDKNETLQSTMNYTITSFDLNETGKIVSVGNTIGWKFIIRGAGKSGEIVDTPAHSLSVCDDKFELKGDIIKKIESKCKIDISLGEAVPVE